MQKEGRKKIESFNTLLYAYLGNSIWGIPVFTAIRKCTIKSTTTLFKNNLFFNYLFFSFGQLLLQITT